MPLARLATLGLLVLAACSSTPKARPRSSLVHAEAWQPARGEEGSYGFSPDHPIHVGGGPEGQHAFLEALRGPEGQSLAWRRLGSCCAFETPNGFMGQGLLDMYEVIYEGMEQPVILYLDMYDSEQVAAPAGFTLSDEERPAETPPSKPRIIEL
ncbi:hypothetical protein [Hyalangium sp.]|uniref:hypothetical protein n=1 Tax=Hyalangium sp. TaxID=2028555 RepID=UPI002D6CDB0A|nr:hypothetical protein [Hyalangium sp.]HYH94836.1 hypothetical protein [Hyalangium sp.]